MQLPPVIAAPMAGGPSTPELVGADRGELAEGPAAGIERALTP